MDKRREILRRLLAWEVRSESNDIEYYISQALAELDALELTVDELAVFLHKKMDEISKYGEFAIPFVNRLAEALIQACDRKRGR